MSKELTSAEQEYLCKRLANLIALGSTHEAARAQLGLSPYELRKYLADPVTQAQLRDLTEEAGKAALTKIKKGIAGLADLTLTALRKQLERGNMQAVRTALEAMGALEREQGAAQDTSITVVLPGAAEPQPCILVESTPVEPTEDGPG